MGDDWQDGSRLKHLKGFEGTDLSSEGLGWTEEEQRGEQRKVISVLRFKLEKCRREGFPLPG